MIINDKEVGSFEVVRYTFQIVAGEPKIIIHQIKVLDTNSKYIKFAKLSGIINYLHLFDVKFKDITNTKE